MGVLGVFLQPMFWRWLRASQARLPLSLYYYSNLYITHKFLKVLQLKQAKTTILQGPNLLPIQQKLLRSWFNQWKTYHFFAWKNCPRLIIFSHSLASLPLKIPLSVSRSQPSAPMGTLSASSISYAEIFPRDGWWKIRNQWIWDTKNLNKQSHEYCTPLPCLKNAEKKCRNSGWVLDLFIFGGRMSGAL